MRRTLLIALIAATLWVGNARGQQKASGSGSTADDLLTRFVPVSTRIFVRVNNLREVDAAMKKAHAWQLLALASGGQRDVVEFDVRAIVGALLGGRSRVSTAALMRTQVALAARSWSELEGAVWYLRVPDKRTLDAWFPPRKRRESRISPDARLIKMPSGVIACVRDGVVALGRRFEPDSLLRETVRLMAGRRATALLQSEAYQSLATYLPGHPLATVFLVADPNRSTAAATNPVRSVWDIIPDMKYVIIGMFEREGRIDLTVRGTRVSPTVSTALPARVLKRLHKLPYTTLLASAATVPVTQWLLAMRNDAASTDTLSRYVRVLLSLRSMAVGADVPLPPIGPSMILAWDEDFRGKSSTPQLALLIESSDARALAREVGAIAQKLIELAHSLDPVDIEYTPAVSLDVHLGTPIAHASLAEYARRSSFPIARLFGHVEISWAAYDGWLILTLSRDHLERILDAGVGLAPTLATVRDAHSVWQLGGKQNAAVLVQADAAAAVMSDWLVDAANGNPSLLTFDAAKDRGMTREPDPLGIEFGASSEGAASVESIDGGSPAFGKLRAGDRILGIDGQLLDFALPDRDLQRRWSIGGKEALCVVRILRGGKVVDVELNRASRAAISPGFARDVTAAVQELVDVGRAISFAGLSVLETDEDHFAAMLSLRFAGKVERSAVRAP